MTMVTTDHDENCDDIGNDKVEAILVLLVTSSWASFAHTDQTPAVVDEHNDDAHHEDGDEDGDNDDAPSEDDANDDAPQEDDDNIDAPHEDDDNVDAPHEDDDLIEDLTHPSASLLYHLPLILSYPNHVAQFTSQTALQLS